jgi:hypothetical protein
MFICVHATNDVTFEDRDNFRAFKVVVRIPQATLEEAQIALAGLATLPDRETAWVSADALRQWSGVRDNPDWQKNFDAMIEKAKPHGWIDESNNTIKAHVEWAE